ncbi:hypothetical protein GMLC_20950 [Geomonas limicola]|uniref:Oxygen-independent coproporphyrinogen III oxidase n=1 Tax=Geomonas limicola TaxID=2740186 RepID=A0A6V8N7H1_9BACT|nr:oxygen-independent coproporphyrinogen III oxidase [Geomonas limicola]GFO68516.1 hypothetical protein GMLC_20950 [Geomonas limicola]
MTTVGLVQINNSFSDACYLPYSVGLLQAYFQEHSPRAAEVSFLTPLYRRIPMAEALRHLEPAAVVGISCYAWNAAFSVELARQLKAADPGRLVVLGGPQVPDHAEPFLREHPYIDLICHGEGEVVFTEILNRVESRAWDGIPGLSYLAGGEFRHTPVQERIKDLNRLPSPYLSGVFEPLLREDRGHQWLALWETNRGCPFSCAYCYWGSATKSELFCFEQERLDREIAWFAAKRIEFVFCCDANFGLLPRDLEITRSVARQKEQSGYPMALSVQNTKTSAETSYEIQRVLSASGLNKGVNLALQSVHPETLAKIGRKNIPVEVFQELQQRFSRDKVETFTDIILGLPGESYASFTAGIDQIVRHGQHHRIQFINLSILANAPMSEPAYRAEHGIETVRTPLVNIHGMLEQAPGEVQESQELVIATASLPREEWVRTRAYSWMASLLYFDKLLQIPLALVGKLEGTGFSRLIELFMAADAGRYPIIHGINAFFEACARDIQQGGREFLHAPEWLGIFWPQDEYLFIKLSVEGKLDQFYREAEALLTRETGCDPALLTEALALNRQLVKQPFVSEDCVITLGHNVWELYRSVLSGAECHPVAGTRRYRIDRSAQRWTSWEQWFRAVVWYGNKKGAYLYGVDNQTSAQEVAMPATEAACYAAVHEKYGINILNYGSFMYNEYPHKSVWDNPFPLQGWYDTLDRLGRAEANPLLMYVHVPFCPKQCFYCLCNTIISSNQERISRYLDYLHREIGQVGAFFQGRGLKPNFRRIHIGGGSPTALSRADFGALVARLRELIDFEELDEFTLEIDPRGVSADDLAFYASQGVSRLSLGIQDFDPDVQRAINRIQPPALVKELLAPEVRALFKSVNFDVLCGLPRQTMASFLRTIDTVVELAPDRIMVMFLTLAPEVRAHQNLMPLDTLPDLETRTALYLAGVRRLMEHGYQRIGADHFAKPENDLARAAQAGTLQWNSLGYVPVPRLDVLGVGIGSSSFLDDDCYVQNSYEMDEYEKAIDAGLPPIFRGYQLTSEDLLRAEIINEIRCRLSLDLAGLEARHALIFRESFAEELEQLKVLEADGLISLSASRLEVSELGRYYTGLILSVFDTRRQGFAIQPARRVA